MNQANANEPDHAPIGVVPPHQLFVPAWTAYVRPVVVLLMFCAVGFAMTQLFVLQVLTIASIGLYSDEDGVWVRRGIFPWSRGIYGVKWRDLDEAQFEQSFFSWMFKSFTVILSHRFTKDSEISLPHIRHGDRAAAHLNELHQRGLRTE